MPLGKVLTHCYGKRRSSPPKNEPFSLMEMPLKIPLLSLFSVKNKSSYDWVERNGSFAIFYLMQRLEFWSTSMISRRRPFRWLREYEWLCLMFYRWSANCIISFTCVHRQNEMIHELFSIPNREISSLTVAWRWKQQQMTNNIRDERAWDVVVSYHRRCWTWSLTVSLSIDGV